MGIHKWEIRYPLLLLLSLIPPAHLQQETCNKHSARNQTCQDAGGFEQVIGFKGNCLSSECFTDETREAYGKIKSKLNELTPEIRRSGNYPNQVGVPFNLTCTAWATFSKGLKNVKMTTKTAPVLPEPEARRRLYFLVGATVTSVASFVTIQMELAGNRHKQNITCTMEFDSGTATEGEKKRSANDSLYAFAQTPPLIQGPRMVEAGTAYKWDCVTEEVTVDKPTQFRLTLSTKPAPPQPPTLDENYQTLGSSDSPLRFKVAKSMRFTVPPSFRPAFFVHCKGENTVLGIQRKVEMPSPLLRVKVVTKPYDLSTIFTIVGVSFGFGGFALGSALVIFYWRKKKAEEKKT